MVKGLGKFMLPDFIGFSSYHDNVKYKVLVVFTTFKLQKSYFRFERFESTAKNFLNITYGFNLIFVLLRKYLI